MVVIFESILFPFNEMSYTSLLLENNVNVVVIDTASVLQPLQPSMD